MIIETVAAGAVAVLAPYLAKAGEGFASKVGEKLAEKAASLCQAVKDQFKGDADATQTLMQVETKPDSKGRLAALEEVLVGKMKANAEFANLLNRLVEEARTADTNGVLVFGSRNIVVGGSGSGGTFVTGDNAQIGKP